MENQQLDSPSRQSSSTPAGFRKGFLARYKMTTLEHPPYSNDLAAVDFYLFHRMKSTLKGRRFCDVTVVTKNATEELKMLSQNGFQGCFQQLYSR
jgi:hypothetical protein